MAGHVPASVTKDEAAMEHSSTTKTSTDEVESTINRPGSVMINVQGAFIVETDTSTPVRSVNDDGRVSPSGHETSDIRLPNHNAVVSHVAIDIGGTLAKLVYFSREAESEESGGRLNFQSFETDRIDDCIEFIKNLKNKQSELTGSKPSELIVMATGGGAFKYYDQIKSAIDVDVIREDEMECLIIGLDFFMTEIPREVFTYSDTEPMHYVVPHGDIYPYLLCNIGSGVSFIKVNGLRSYERVGGTSLGGGTFWGLLSLLTGASTFDEMLVQAAQGDNSKVDMLVGDIYGSGYGKIGLKSNIIASSFGKVFRRTREAESAAESNDTSATAQSSDPTAPMFDKADISKSLLFTISNNIGQIAYLQSQICGVTNIYFGGSFIRGYGQTMNTLSFAINFWSKGAKQAYFLRHEGYLGSVGAFLKRQPPNWGRKGSVEEVKVASFGTQNTGKDEQTQTE